ncbi:hypothetical protein ZWY2020_037127 [Hordeum vulgare]|nr:hypothetical protein ZWY2020_037127 [Hordeum vulgare]
MDLGSSCGMSFVAVHGGILWQDAGVLQRYVNPSVVFEDAARHGHDEFDLVERGMGFQEPEKPKAMKPLNKCMLQHVQLQGSRNQPP